MKLRKATMEDADFLLGLKNDPVMRKFAVVTHDKIKKRDHLKWLPEHLDEIKIVVSADGKDRLGMFRVSKEGEVSINLHPSARGKGVGQEVLSRHCPPNVWAKIVDGNFHSLNLFLKNGFKLTEYHEREDLYGLGYYVLTN